MDEITRGANGRTSICKEALVRLYTSKLKASEYKLIFYLLVCGCEDLTIENLADHLNLSAQTTYNAIREISKRNIIIIERHEEARFFDIDFNSNYNEWRIFKR